MVFFGWKIGIVGIPRTDEDETDMICKPIGRIVVFFSISLFSVVLNIA